MTTHKEALTLALEAAKEAMHWLHAGSQAALHQTYVIRYLNQALAQPEQEPVPALYVKDINGNFHLYKEKGHTVSSQCVPPSLVRVGKDYSTPQPKEPEQEPVAILQCQLKHGPVLWHDVTDEESNTDRFHPEFFNFRIVYTTPPQRKPLTDEQIYQMWTDEGLANSYEIYSLKEHVRRTARAIEAAHGIVGDTYD